MKKLFLITIMLFATAFTNAQDTSSTKSSGVDVYVATGLSMSNTGDTTFTYSSYPSIELGIMKDNFCLGLVVGRWNLEGFDNDVTENYWYELKTAVSFPLGNYSGYGLLGVGNYMSTERIFIEYGLGFSRTFNKIGVFSQVSNWDGYWYLTPGLSYTF